jgi:hypothetical protein
MGPRANHVAGATALPAPYARNVISAQSPSSLAAATAPLFSSFGDNLTLWRDGNVVHWSYEGQTVIVAQQADGAASATFVDAPTVDAVSGSAVSAIYRRTAERRYQMTPESCQAMVADMMAFFSGDREPIFIFTGARSLDA